MKHVLLERQSLSPRTPTAILVKPTLQKVQELLPAGSGEWAIDCETRGLDAWHPDSLLVGIGLANADRCLYIDMRHLPDDVERYLHDWLSKTPLVAFNVLFDAAWLQAWLGYWPKIIGDAYGLFKQLSSEGWTGQSWSLESAQLSVLGWPLSNKDALGAALKERGLTKADMWQLPPETLGPYCASDADAAWQLWRYMHELCVAKLSQLGVSS